MCDKSNWLKNLRVPECTVAIADIFIFNDYNLSTFFSFPKQWQYDEMLVALLSRWPYLMNIYPTERDAKVI